MRAKLMLLILAVGLLAVGCARKERTLSNVSLGMTKTQVIEAIGTPDTASAKGQTEYLLYQWFPTFRWQYVRLISGKVESYGTVDNFDSEGLPEIMPAGAASVESSAGAVNP